eukprot:g590.t1
MTLVSQELNQKEIPDLHLAPSAVKRLKELEEESPGSTLRVTVEGGGCSGFQYKFTLDEKTQQDDLLFENEGVKILCDQLSYQFLRGATIEFADSLMRSSFQVKDNPNSESSCGCGTSFVAKDVS